MVRVQSFPWTPLEPIAHDQGIKARKHCASFDKQINGMVYDLVDEIGVRDEGSPKELGLCGILGGKSVALTATGAPD